VKAVVGEARVTTVAGVVDGAAAFAVHDSPHVPLHARLHRLLCLHRSFGRKLGLVVFLLTLSTTKPRTPTLLMLAITKKGATTKRWSLRRVEKRSSYGGATYGWKIGIVSRCLLPSK
jgi:hypothetical protein